MFRRAILIFLVLLTVLKSAGQVLGDAVDTGGIYGEPAYDYLYITRPNEHYNKFSFHKQIGLLDGSENIMMTEQYDDKFGTERDIKAVDGNEKETLKTEVRIQRDTVPYTEGSYKAITIFDSNGEPDTAHILIERDGKVGLYNSNGRLIFTCAFDSVVLLEKGLFVCREKLRWALVDSAGNNVTGSKYVRTNFELIDGCLFVKNENGKWGVVNRTGIELVPCMYDTVTNFAEGFAVCVDHQKYLFFSLSRHCEAIGKFKKAKQFSGGLAAVMDDKERWGYVDSLGRMRMPYKFDYANRFQGNVAEVGLRKHGYLINKKGERMFRFRNLSIPEFKHGVARTYDDNHSKMGMVNNRGKKLLSCKYSYVSNIPEKGYIMAEHTSGFRVNSLMILDTGGKIITKRLYNRCEGLDHVYDSGFCNGRLCVGRIVKGGNSYRASFGQEYCKWGYINKQGDEVVPCKFGWGGPFINGVANVYWQDCFRQIDTNGNFVRGISHDGLYKYIGVYKGGVAVAMDDKDYWGFVDTTGKQVIKCDFEGVKNFSGGLAPVNRNGKWGYIDKKGNVAIQPQFEAADTFGQGVAVVELGGYYRFVNKSGDFINERKYSRVQFCTGKWWLVERKSKGFLVDRQGNEILVYTRNKKRKVGYFDSHDLVEIDSFVYSIDSWGMSKLTFVCDTNKIRPVYSFKDLCYTEGKRLKVDKNRGQKMEAIAASKQWGEGEIFDEMFVRVRVDDMHLYRGHRDTKTYKYGLVDTNDRLVTPVKFEEIQHFSDGMASARLNGKWGYLDTSGRLVIKNTYKSANDFGCGVAAVELDGKWILINKKGERVRQMGTKIETSYYPGW